MMFQNEITPFQTKFHVASTANDKRTMSSSLLHQYVLAGRFRHPQSSGKLCAIICKYLLNMMSKFPGI